MARIERLAIHADLFAQRNQIVSGMRIREFWECVDRKFVNLVCISSSVGKFFFFLGDGLAVLLPLFDV